MICIEGCVRLFGGWAERALADCAPTLESATSVKMAGIIKLQIFLILALNDKPNRLSLTRPRRGLEQVSRW